MITFVLVFASAAGPYVVEGDTYKNNDTLKKINGII